MMFCIYGLIAFLTLSTVAINMQPYKKTAYRYSIMDTVFYILLSLVFIAIISRDVAKFFSITFNTLFPLLIGSIPIVPVIPVRGISFVNIQFT